MKKLILAGLALAAAVFSIADANAQAGIAFTPGAPVLPRGAEGLRPTFSATATALAPAASATDVACIAASSSKLATVTRVAVSGTAATLVSTPVILTVNATVDTGGTAATGNALPVAVKHDPASPAASVTLTAYTANPTITDGSAGRLRAGTVTLPTAAAGTVIVPAAVTFGDRNGLGLKLPKGSTRQLCVNLNGVSVATGSLQVEFEWVEE